MVQPVSVGFVDVNESFLVNRANAVQGQMEPIAGDEWRLADRPERLTHSYTLTAVAR